ncbi:MAG: macro domain-containing protein [Candidatus Saccharicenans sp.]|uniref:macro domain-containing protein n=1 Tax=Candidatus Saccharicenans sp. TaxID=2819258 RepID=UPI00404998EC
MIKEISGVTIELVQGNIVEQPDIMAIVNAANAHLRPGGGVAGAIHRAAGPALEEECQKYAPIEPGQAVITGGHNLPNKYVIHTLGPVYGVDKPEDKLLADCYRNSLLLAEEHAIESIAFPAISTGVFRYPLEKATEVALKTVLGMIPQLKRVKKIRFVLFSESDLLVYEAELSRLTADK